MDAKTVCRKAAAYLRTYGWHQGIMGIPGTSMCLVGALRYAAGFESPMTPSIAYDVFNQAVSLLFPKINAQVRGRTRAISLVVWNDTALRRVEEVLALLDDAAKEE